VIITPASATSPDTKMQEIRIAQNSFVLILDSFPERSIRAKHDASMEKVSGWRWPSVLEGTYPALKRAEKN